MSKCAGKKELKKKTGEWITTECSRPAKVGVFCERHARYGKLYEDTLASVKHCSQFLRGCDVILEATYDKVTCESCLKKKNKKSNNPDCEGKWTLTKTTDVWTNEACDRKVVVGDDLTGRFCGKHERLGKLHEDTLAGVRHCYGYLRGCDVILAANYPKESCEDCLAKDRQKDKSRRDAKIEIHTEQLEAGSDTLKCVVCSAEKPKEEFVNALKMPTTKCSECLNKARAVEENRPERDRTEWSKDYHSRPEVKERKREWREENSEKVKEYYRSYRDRKLVEDGPEYMIRARENQIQWRKKNPDRHQAIQERSKNSFKYKIGYYKLSSEEKGVMWELSDDDVKIMFESECWYCGAQDDLNGLDRLDSDGPYSSDNTRSCCTMCNFSKGGLSVERFVSQSARIVTFICDESYDMCETLFENINYESPSGEFFQDYKNKAKKRNITCELSEEQYEEIVMQNCYLCGNSPEGWCGIDRRDNTVGYVIDNCFPCCNLCNMMKRDETYDSFIERCKDIVSTFSGKDLSEIPQSENPMRKRMAKRATEKPLAKLTRREKAVIRWHQRNIVKEWAGDSWAAISARVDTGKGSTDDVRFMQELEVRTKNAMKFALDEKIKNLPSPKRKRKYVKSDPATESETETEKKRRQEREKKARWREKQHSKKIEKIHEKKAIRLRTESEKREYERERKSVQRAKKREQEGKIAVKHKRTESEQREYERQRKAGYRKKIKNQ